MNNDVISLQQVDIMELELELNGFCTQQNSVRMVQPNVQEGLRW